MARGFNKPRNQFITLRQGYLEALFTYNRFKGMGTLNDVDVTERYKNVNENFDVYTHASYILEVITRALEDDIAEPGYYRLLKKAFKLLDEGNSTYGVTSLVLVKMLPAYGGQLNLGSCAVCGRNDYKKYSHYSFKYHNVLCCDCLTDDTLERAIPVSNRVLYFALYLQLVRLDDINSVKLSNETGRQLLKFIEVIYDEYSGVYFRSKKMIDPQ
ncbi:DNA repair protein RecO [Jeotgalicoccus saudimassiliensis]|uniref:DNA repair protein RecO n=2 Tax=Jeotgalicoccus saudimassiliensis TaxID=1461582 RepID=A0A078M3W6_9STAP|nr:DNA repair protein RecO [Jeotgalicoccus saudimassiliensis]